MKNNEAKQKSLERALYFLMNTFESLADGMILTGTMAHSRDYAINQGSDLDTIVLCDSEKIHTFLRTPIFTDYNADTSQATTYLDERKVDLVSIRHSIDGDFFTVHFMSEEIFEEKFCQGSKPRTLYSFRKTPKEYTYVFRSFKGEEISFPVENTPVEGGFKVPMETSRIVNGTYFSGSPNNKLMSNPLILFEKRNLISRSIQNLREDLISRMLLELERDYSNADSSLLNTLVRYSKINPDVLKSLKNREKKDVRLYE